MKVNDVDPVGARPSTSCGANAQWDSTDSSGAQSVSQTGLLPVYGVDFSFDKSWVDGASFPSTSAGFANSGVNAAFQQVWDALKSSGFNVVRFPIDVTTTKESAARLANLCVWAKANNVSLVPVFVGADAHKPLPADYATSAASLVKETLGQLKSGDGSHIADYTRIMAFQLGEDVNRLGADSALQVIKQAASGLRAAEQEVLNGTGLSATAPTTATITPTIPRPGTGAISRSVSSNRTWL